MRVRALGILFVLCCLAATAFAGDKPEDLIQKHLDSIGTAAARAAATGRSFEGTNVYDRLSKNSAHVEGTAKFASAKQGYRYVSDFKYAGYYGEQIGWVNDKPEVMVLGQEGHSSIALFFYLHPYLLRDHLFGGVLNADWALSNISAYGPKLKVNGLKKHNNQQLIELRYDPKKSEGDMSVFLYFDPTTYRHVATMYLFNGQTGGRQSGGYVDALRSQERVEEEFSDFREEGGLMLPHRWDIHHSSEQQDTGTDRWTVTIKKLDVGTAQ